MSRIPEVGNKISVDLDWGIWETGEVVYKQEKEEKGEKYFQIVVDFGHCLTAFTVGKTALGEYKLYGGGSVWDIKFVA